MIDTSRLGRSYCIASSLLWCNVALLWCLQTDRLHGQQIELQNGVAEQYWERLQDTDAERGDRSADAKLEYWAEVGQKAYELYSEIIEHPRRGEIIEFIISQFGKHGPEADLRVILLDDDSFLPDWSPRPYGRIDSPDDRLRSESRVLVARLIVERAAHDPEFLQRYCHIVLWSRTLLGSRAESNSGLVVGYIQRNLRNGPREEFPWHARNFVLLAHLAQRDDLIRGRSLVGLKKSVQQYVDWVQKNHRHFAVDAKNHRWHLQPKAAPDEHDVLDDVTLPNLPAPSVPLPDWKDGPLDARTLLSAV